MKYEVENLGPHNAHMSTLKVLLPPKVYFIRRTPVDGQTEADVSPIACSEVEEVRQTAHTVSWMFVMFWRWFFFLPSILALLDAFVMQSGVKSRSKVWT